MVGEARPARGRRVALWAESPLPASTCWPTTVPVASGAVSPTSPLAYTSDTPTVTLNGETVSNVPFSGLTPTVVGLYQIDFQVPADAANGDLTLVVTQPGFMGTPVILPVHN